MSSTTRPTTAADLPFSSPAGFLHDANRDALDWRGGLLAYGCQALVVIVDPDAVAAVQTLDGHKSHVRQVRWAPRSPLRCTLLEDDNLILASAEVSGQIIIWDVTAGTPLCWLSEIAGAPTTRSLGALNMHWLPHRPGVLICVHAPSTLAAYQLRSGPPSAQAALGGGTLLELSSSRAQLLWRIELPEVVHDVAFDVHGGGRVVLYCGRGTLLQFGPLNTQGQPQRIGTHERALMSLSTGEAGGGSSTGDSRLGGGNGNGTSVGSAIAGGKSGASGMQNIVAIEYAIDESDHLYIVMPREIVLWDLSIGQPLASIRLDRTDHDFTAMAQSLALPATVLATHKDGCLSCWQRCSSDAATNAEGGGGAAPGSPLNPLPGSPSMNRTRIYFQFRSMVPLLKGGGSSLVSFAPSKPSGTRFGGVSADGRVWLWTLPSPLTGTAVGRPPSRVAAGGNSGSSIMEEGGFVAKSASWQLEQCGLLPAIGAPITSMSLQPPSEHSANARDASQLEGSHRLLALGVSGSGGRIVLMRMHAGRSAQATGPHSAMVGEYEVHSSAPARGVQWCGRRHVLSYSSVQGGPGSTWVNSVRVLHLPSGACHDAVPAEKAGTAPISAMRLSPSGRRLVLMHRDAPLQIWDLPTKTPLATHFVALPGGATLEWIPATMKAPGATATAAAEQVESVAAAARDAFEAAAVDAVASAAGDAVAAAGHEARLAAAKASAAEAAQAEELVFAVPDGSLFHVRVRGTRLLSSRSASAGVASRDEFDVAEGVLTALAIGGGWVASGTTEGVLLLWTRDHHEARQTIPTQRGTITSISISEGDAAAPRRVLVLFAEGDLAVWDLPRSPPWSVAGPHVALRASAGPARALIAGFAPSGQPMIACDDGSVRLLRRDLTRGNARATQLPPKRPSGTPREATLCAALLPKRERLVLHAQLIHSDLPQLTRAAEGVESAEGVENEGVASEGAVAAPPLLPPLPHLSVAILSSLLHAKTLPTRCRLAAEALGLEHDARFWMIAEDLLARPKPPPPPPPLPPPSGTSSSPQAANGRGERGSPSTGVDSPVLGVAAAASPSPEEGDVAFDATAALPHVFGALRDADTLRNAELSRLAQRVSPAYTTGRHVAQQGAFDSIGLGARAQAVALLLGTTEPAGGTPYQQPQQLPTPENERDWLMACVVAGFCDPAMQASTMAAVADRFCAAGKLQIGVPLLFLIGRGVDACARLQASGRWEAAATLAKASLPASERNVVLGKWVDHLVTRGDQHRAVEVLLSLGKVQEVAERLLELRAFDKAALLLCALREAHENRRGEVASFAFRGAARVLLEYAAFLSRISLNQLAVRYTSLACATADSVASLAESGAAEVDDALTEIEAAQLVVQLARLQEMAEAQLD